MKRNIWLSIFSQAQFFMLLRHHSYLGKSVLLFTVRCRIAVSDLPSDVIVCPRYLKSSTCSIAFPPTFISTVGFSGCRLIYPLYVLIPLFLSVISSTFLFISLTFWDFSRSNLLHNDELYHSSLRSLHLSFIILSICLYSEVPF